ncbi:MAG: tetratricopeptide repeat protein [Chitinophagales bacterium]
MGDVAGGADFLRSLLASRPDSPVFRETLGDYLDRWGTEVYENREVDRAIGILEEAQPLVPGRVSTLRTLTFALNDKKEYATAVIYAEKWLTLEDTPDVRAVLGEIYAGAYDLDRAIPMLQSAAGTVAEEQRIILLGRCFMEKGQLDLAIETLKQGPVNKRKMDPQVIEAKYWLGVAYLKAGQKAKAKTQLAKVYAEDVNYKEIKQLAAEVGLTGSDGRRFTL